MTKQKDLKRLIRARMDKTGESYTAARAHILAKRSPRSSEYPTLAGMSDDAVRASTGRTWAEWVADLDAIEAITMSHKAIAKHVQEHNEISGWWAQTVTVGYERIRGLRALGQQREGPNAGLFEVSKSKTFGVPVATLYAYFGQKSKRAQWIVDHEPEVTTSQLNRSVRMRWPDGTQVNAWFTDKGPTKSTVQVMHRKLPTRDAGEEWRAYWGERLVELNELIGTA